MKIKTVFEKRFPETEIKEKKNKIFVALLILSTTVINQIIPFTLGVYFGLTKSVYLFFIFIFFLFFEVRITFDKKNNIKIKVLRGI